MATRSNIAFAAALVFAIAGVSAAIAALHFLNPAPVGALIPPDQRRPASISYPSLEGKAFSTADHAGQVVLLNYFATWCPPCRDEIPDLEKIAAQGPALVVAVSLDQPDAGRPALLAGFAKEQGIAFPILLPPQDSPLFRTEMSIPQTILIDKRGRDAYHVTGRIDPAEVRALIARLQAE